MQIRKAQRKFRYLKIGVGGITGSGKTLGALRLAYGICGDWDKICVIDSENNSADLYAHLGDYSVYPMESFSPNDYIAAISGIEQAGFEVCIIDSLSHEWCGTSGALELVDKAAKTSRSGNSYTAWGDVTPLHQKFVNSWLQSKMHIIATMRQKDEYVIEQNAAGKMAPKRVGLKNIQRDGVDYEFDILFTIHESHYVSTTKDRTMLFSDKPAFMLDEDVGVQLRKWAGSNEDVLASEIKSWRESVEELLGKVGDVEIRKKATDHYEQSKNDLIKLKAIETRLQQIIGDKK